MAINIIQCSSTVYRDNEGSCPKKSPLNQLFIYFVTPRQHWSCITELKNVFRSALHPTTKFI